MSPLLSRCRSHQPPEACIQVYHGEVSTLEKKKRWIITKSHQNSLPATKSRFSGHRFDPLRLSALKPMSLDPSSHSTLPPHLQRQSGRLTNLGLTKRNECGKAVFYQARVVCTLILSVNQDPLLTIHPRKDMPHIATPRQGIPPVAGQFCQAGPPCSKDLVLTNCEEVQPETGRVH